MRAGGRSESGFTLLEVLVSLVILSGAIAGLAVITQGYADSAQRALVAQQVRTLGDAAKAYIRDNYAAVQAIATPTAPALIEVTTLIASGHLTTGFAVANGLNQSMCVLVLEPTANRLQALVVAEGGTGLDDLSLGDMAATIGGSGGGVYSTDATTIKGSLGGWQIPVLTFDNLTNNVNRRCSGATGNVRITTGRPAMALWFENGDTSAAFLARDAVPGRPELNQINTPVVLNSVQTSGAACTLLGAIARDSTGSILSCQGGAWKSQGSAYWQDPVATFALLPTCNAAALNQTRVVGTPTTGSGPRAYTCNGSSWQPLAADDGGNITLAGKVTAAKIQLTDTVTKGAACTPAGLVSRNAAGEIFTCQGSVWTPQGPKFSTSTLVAYAPYQDLYGCGGVGGTVNVTTPGFYGIQLTGQAFRYAGTYVVLYLTFSSSAGGLCTAQDNMMHSSYGGGYLSPNNYCIAHLDAGTHSISVGGSDAGSCGASYLQTFFGGSATLRLLSAD